jgi:isopentenyl phosphate kinase
MEALREAGVPAVALAPVAGVIARDGQAMTWDLLPLKAALQARLLPVVYGDVVFDMERGGTILSTEALFAFLARDLRPSRILLAGLEPAVWADFPGRTRRVEQITSGNYAAVSPGVGKAAGADVTGGMEAKVSQMLALVRELPGLTAQIFSAEQPGNLERALAGENVGTVISA